jgi:hypothetical protein
LGLLLAYTFVSPCFDCEPKVKVATFFFSTTPTIEEGNGNLCRSLLLCNTTTKEDNNALLSSSSSQT